MLASLATLKLRLNFSQTTHDAKLLEMLDQATATAERLVGRPLCYQAAITETPQVRTAYGSRFLELSRGPIRSITSVHVRHSLDTTWANATELTEDDDFRIDSTDMARLERINGYWPGLHGGLVRVIYDGGYIPAQTVALSAVTEATWDESQMWLQEVGAFEAYVFTPGDHVVITSGTTVTPGAYRIASREGDNAIVLASSPAPGNDDAAAVTVVTGLPGTYKYAPKDLQLGLLAEATRLWQTRDNAALERASLGGGGSIDFNGEPVAVELQRACQALKRIRI